MKEQHSLPPGQRALEHFPRFGLNQFANRFPTDIDRINLRVGGCVDEETTLSDDLHTLQRIEQVSDFHCVTTWSKTGLCWSGYRFSDVHRQLIAPAAQSAVATKFISFPSQDGYRIVMPLEYLLASDVLFADRLNGEPLGIEHGAPVRLVAPAHYGYKNPKHLMGLECLTTDRLFKPVSFRFMAHPTARVALEERAIGAPGWVSRYLYRPLIAPTIRSFAKASEQYRRKAIVQ